MSDIAVTVRLQHADGESCHPGIDTVVIEHDGRQYRIGVRHGRLEMWTRMAQLCVLPLHQNTVAIESRGERPAVDHVTRERDAARAALNYLASHVDGYDDMKEFAEDIATGRRSADGSLKEQTT